MASFTESLGETVGTFNNRSLRSVLNFGEVVGTLSDRSLRSVLNRAVVAATVTKRAHGLTRTAEEVVGVIDVFPKPTPSVILSAITGAVDSPGERKSAVRGLKNRITGLL